MRVASTSRTLRTVRTIIAATGLALLIVATAVVWPAIGARRVVTTESPRSAGSAPKATLPSPITAADAERAFTVALNDRRRKIGVRTLAIDPALTAMARGWSAHMAASQRLAHNPALTTQAPPGWHKLGENVGVGGTVAAIHVAFLRSPEHYRNIADPEFDRVGIGVVVQGRLIWVTVDFEQPAAAAPGH